MENDYTQAKSERSNGRRLRRFGFGPQIGKRYVVQESTVESA